MRPGSIDSVLRGFGIFTGTPGRLVSSSFFSLVLAFVLTVASVGSAADQPSLPTLTPDAKQAAERGLILFRNNQFAEAKKEFEKMTQLAPAHPMGWANLGSAEFRLGQTKEAEEHLKKAVQLDPTAAQAWLTLGILYYQKNDLDAGLAALSEAVYHDPNNASAHLYLGVLVRKRGWVDAAEDELRKAVEIDENYAEAHYNLAVLYLEQNPPSIELARRHYYRALRLGAAPDPELEKTLNHPN